MQKHYHKVMFSISEKRMFDGFTLYCMFQEQSKDFFKETVDALTLIKKVDPRRYARTKKSLPIIAYVKQGINCYNPTAKAFYVDEFRYPDQYGAYAGLIVHEATHGYLRERRFELTLETQKQHEFICLDEQSRFMKRVIEDMDASNEEKREFLEDVTKRFGGLRKSEWYALGKTRAAKLVRLHQVLREELFSVNPKKPA
ncbi:MAG: hypothetical protein Q7J69_05785, partial [Candidatus Omnitrophota bacterium]|nr:hypothetical protein [Candidatus Omnitrophota bacterium]